MLGNQLEGIKRRSKRWNNSFGKHFCSSAWCRRTLAAVEACVASTSCVKSLRRMCHCSDNTLALALCQMCAVRVLHTTNMEHNLHAKYTIVFLCNNCCVLLAFTGHECDISVYTEAFTAAIECVPIVSGATAWTCMPIHCW